MTVGEKIQYYRKQKGLSQEELGKLLIVSRQTVSQWENGQTYPTVDNLMRLREVFGITMDDLVKEGEPALPETAEEPLEIYDSRPTQEEINRFLYKQIKNGKRYLWADLFLDVFFAFFVTFLWLVFQFRNMLYATVAVMLLGFVSIRWYQGVKEMRSLHRTTKMAFEQKADTVIKVFRDHFVLFISKDGAEYASQHIAFSDVGSVGETQDFYIAESGSYRIFFRKKELVDDSVLKRLLQEKIAERKKTTFTVDQTVRILWIRGGVGVLLAAAMLLPIAVIAFDLPKTVYWADVLPFGATFALVGYLLYHWKKASKIFKSAMPGVLVLLLAVLICRMSLGQWFPEDEIVFSTDAEYVQRAENVTDMDLPEGYYITVEPANEIRGSAHYYWDALLEYYEVDEIHELVHQDARWISSSSFVAYKLIPDWYPEDEELWDRVAIYNITTDEWNTAPEDEEECRYVAFLWYQSGEMLVITEFKK